jgi:two-component system, NtrC family, response regulator AtoC
MPVRTILIVDDDAEMRALLVEVLGQEGYRVVEAADGAEALIRLRSECFDGIIIDKNMPGLSGLDLLPGLRMICPAAPIILITAFGDASTYVEALEKGAFEYIFKPFRLEDLLRVLGRAVPTQDPQPRTWGPFEGRRNESVR